VPSQEDSTVQEGKDAEDLSDPEDPPSDDAEESGPTDETPPAPNDDGPTDHDRVLPLTDKEWAEHVTEVRDTLDKARAAGLTTDRLYTINGTGEIWSGEREIMHDSIIDHIYASAVNVPCNFEALIAGGLGGAGKTTVLADHAGVDHSQYLMINPDDIKEEMARRDMLPEIAGISPMEASDLAHEESSHIAKRLANRAQADGKNLIWDITMSSKESTVGRIQALRDAGYGQVDGLFVKISTETSIRRTESRHREGHDKWRAGEGRGGRFVPAEIIDRQNDPKWGSQNRKTYEAIKGRFNAWSIYDNSIDGHPPSLVESSDSAKLQQDNGRRGSDEQRSH
jgi:predicted ABC-type ATPase